MRTRIAAIIPALNEEETIFEVVKAAKKSELLDEVIVVSDGSTDTTAKVAKRAGADKVLNLSKTGGKGSAMLHGITHTDAEIILFLDADLKGLTPEHIKRLVEPVFRGDKVMLVGLVDRVNILTRAFSQFPLIGGQRAMQRFVIENIPDKYFKGFMAESALNFYCRSRSLPYGRIFLPGLKIRRKMQKVGFLNGLFQYVKMIYQIVKANILIRLAKLRGKF